MRQDVADQQGQGDPAVVEAELLEAWVYRHVLRQEGLGEGCHLRPQARGAGHVVAAERVLLDADEMQACIGMGLFGEQLPGAEEVHAGTEAGLADHQATVWGQGGEALRQARLFEEHVAGFVGAFILGEIDVVVLPRVGRPWSSQSIWACWRRVDMVGSVAADVRILCHLPGLRRRYANPLVLLIQ